MKVKITNYTKNIYNQYIKNWKKSDKPINTKYEVGDVVFNSKHNTIGVVLGIIDNELEDLRTDADGMVHFSNIRLAKFSDFQISNVRYKPKLYNELTKYVLSIYNSKTDENEENFYFYSKKQAIKQAIKESLFHEKSFIEVWKKDKNNKYGVAGNPVFKSDENNQYQISLPIFSGFYQGVFSLENTELENKEYNFEKYYISLAKEIIFSYQHLMKKFIIDIQFIEIYSPQEYNFKTDEIIVTVTINKKQIIK